MESQDYKLQGLGPAEFREAINKGYVKPLKTTLAVSRYSNFRSIEYFSLDQMGNLIMRLFNSRTIKLNPDKTLTGMFWKFLEPDSA